MCRYASVVVWKDESVDWFPGVDSHSAILEMVGERAKRELQKEEPDFLEVELVPAHDTRGDVEKWSLEVNMGRGFPEWWSAGHERAARAAVKRLVERELEGFEISCPDGATLKGQRDRGRWKWYEKVLPSGAWERYDGEQGGKRTRVEANGTWTERDPRGSRTTYVGEDGSTERVWYQWFHTRRVERVGPDGAWNVRKWERDRVDGPVKGWTDTWVYADGSWDERRYKIDGEGREQLVSCRGVDSEGKAWRTA